MKFIIKKYLDIKNKDLNGNTIARQAAMEGSLRNITRRNRLKNSMIILGIELVHGISPSGRNDILELCNSLGQAGSVEMTRGAGGFYA
ncbi:MAG: hypothetical protein ACYC49_17625 [Ignavibacteriaceae bacterium]